MQPAWPGRLTAAVGVLWLGACGWGPPCLGQTPLQPSGSLYAVSNGSLTVYTTYTTWTGFWSTSLTLAPGALGARALGQPQRRPAAPLRCNACAGQLVADGSGLYWSPQQPVSITLGPTDASSVERIRECLRPTCPPQWCLDPDCRCAAVPVLSTGVLSVQNAYETQTPCSGSICACPTTRGYAQNSTVFACYSVASSAMPAQLTLQVLPAFMSDPSPTCGETQLRNQGRAAVLASGRCRQAAKGKVVRVRCPSASST